MSETWIINESPDCSTAGQYNISFASNGNSYTYFHILVGGIYGGLWYGNSSDYESCTQIYGSKGSTWFYDYKNITFETSPTGDLLTWLEANAVKQQSEDNTPYIIKKQTLIDIADAIRDKTGSTDAIKVSDMPSQIESISGGGGGGGLDYTITLMVEGATWQIVSVKSGTSLDSISSPSVSGKVFIGWSTTDGGSVNVAFPYNVTGDATLYAVTTSWSCTVKGLGNSDPTTVTFTHSGTMPTFEEITFNGDVMIKIPTMYRKVVAASSQITSFTISTSKVDSTYYPYPCFLKEDGTTVMDYILIGKYMMPSASSASSTGTPGQTSGRATQTISNGRTNARARGTGYQLYDWQMQKLWQDLIICKMNTVNINSGGGITTDALGIEWEKNGGWVDGVCRYTGNYWLFSTKPSLYQDSSTTSTTGYTTGYTHPTSTSNLCISSLGYNSSYPFFNYPNATVSDSNYSTYYCDYFYPGTSTSNPVYSDVGDAYALYGAFLCDAAYSWSNTLGVRLCYRPL